MLGGCRPAEIDDCLTPGYPLASLGLGLGIGS